MTNRERGFGSCIETMSGEHWWQRAPRGGELMECAACGVEGVIVPRTPPDSEVEP